MKRAIQCLGVLLFAFAVTFGFQVNAASANQTCEVTVAQPCSKAIGNGETLIARFRNLSKIKVYLTEEYGKPGSVVAVVAKIGSQKYSIPIPEVTKIQPFGMVTREYSTVGVTGATFTNNAPGSQINIVITSS